MRWNVVFVSFCTAIATVFSPYTVVSSAAEVDETLWEKFLKYDLLITDYDALTAEEQEL